MVWTEPIITRLKELLNLSRRRIAEILNLEFGLQLTRNAISGAIDRRGLSKKTEAPKLKVVQPPRSNFNFRKQRSNIKKPLPPTNSTAENINQSFSCNLFDLTNNTCRWPFGDPSTDNLFFCGVPEADLMANRPYCLLHSRLAAAHP